MRHYLPVRRTLSRRQGSITTTASIYGELDINIPSPRIPNELIDHIVVLALVPSSTTPCISNFSLIAPLTLASVDFRQIALRRFFQTINLETRPNWTGVFNMLKAHEGREATRGIINGGFVWVKSLCASSKILSYKSARLSYLTRLQTLSIDLAHEGLSTQHPRLKTLFSCFPLADIAHTLTSLTLSSLPRIDEVLLCLIANMFPFLINLSLTCTERLEFTCCWACFEDSLGCTVHSPIPDDYFDAIDMADAFGSALKPLTYLTHLHLGVFLSDEQLLYSHIGHSLGDEENVGMAEGSEQCSICIKDVEDVRLRELQASITIARRLKSIRSISWSSFFTGIPSVEDKNQDKDKDKAQLTSSYNDDGPDTNSEDINEKINDLRNDANMKTTIWVLRSNGRIRVRSTPW